MHDIDDVLNGKSVRQHQQDMLRWAQQEHFTREVMAAQPSQTRAQDAPRVAQRLFATLRNFTGARLGRKIRRTAGRETLPVNLHALSEFPTTSRLGENSWQR